MDIITKIYYALATHYKDRYIVVPHTLSLNQATDFIVNTLVNTWNAYHIMCGTKTLTQPITILQRYDAHIPFPCPLGHNSYCQHMECTARPERIQYRIT